VKRSFDERWKHDPTTDRTWLVYDKEKNNMYCSTCQVHAGKNLLANKTRVKISQQWTAGTSNFRLEAVQTHEQSEAHKHCVLLSNSGGSLKQSFRRLSDSVKEAMFALFKLIHFIAVSELALSKFLSFRKFLELQLGFSKFKILSAENASYTSKRFLGEAVSSMVEPIRDPRSYPTQG